MSGGSHDYVYRDVQWKACGKMFDVELNAMLNDLVPVLKALEWWQSGDNSAAVYWKEVEKFKKKWFGDPGARRAELIRKECDRLKEQLLVSFGDKVFDPKHHPWEQDEVDV